MSNFAKEKTADDFKKASSRWACFECGHEVIVAPGTVVKRCCISSCKGEMEYRGGHWVYPGESEYKRLPRSAMVVR